MPIAQGVKFKVSTETATRIRGMQVYLHLLIRLCGDLYSIDRTFAAGIEHKPEHEALWEKHRTLIEMIEKLRVDWMIPLPGYDRFLMEAGGTTIGVVSAYWTVAGRALEGAAEELGREDWRRAGACLRACLRATRAIARTGHIRNWKEGEQA